MEISTVNDAEYKEVKTFQTNEYAQSFAKKDLVNFRIGQPSSKMISLGHFTKAFEAAFLAKERDPTLLAYSVAEGHGDFRASLASWLSSRYGFEVLPEEIVMTNGNTHATDFVVRMLLDDYVRSTKIEGHGSQAHASYIAMDDPTYFLAGGVVKRYVDMLNFNGTKTLGSQPLLTLRV